MFAIGSSRPDPGVVAVPVAGSGDAKAGHEIVVATRPPGSEEFLERCPEDLAPLPEDLKVFSRIEGLLGQEQALLAIPTRERTREEQGLLDAVGAELDRVAERLRMRLAH
jgi:hypothetical protein